MTTPRLQRKQPLNRDTLIFGEDLEGACYFDQEIHGYQLEGRLLTSEDALPGLFCIHGARSDYTKFNPLLSFLLKHGIGSLSFNMSGHNTASPLPLEATSLKMNLAECRAFYDALPACQTVLGQSMGGALALKMAEAYADSVTRIILLCPAIYPEAAYGPHFGIPFRDAISTPFGFMDTTSIAFLRRFTGKVMLVMGEFDGLQATRFGMPAGRSAGTVMIDGRQCYSPIPQEVIHIIENTLPDDKLTKVTLAGCDHHISTWLRQDDAHASLLGQQIRDFLRD